MEPASPSETLQFEFGETAPHFIPAEQFCHITLHSVSSASESGSFKVFSLLVLDPDPSSLVLTQKNLIEDGSTAAHDDVSLVNYFPLELSYSERWVEVTIYDMNTNKTVLIISIELSALLQLHPYHLLASTARISAKLSILKTPSSLYYHSFSGLELAFIPGSAMSPTPTIHTSECVISLEVMNLKPPASYKPNIKFALYSKQHSKMPTFYLATPSVIPKLSRNSAHYAFLADDCFKFGMDSHYVVAAISSNVATGPWYHQSPDILFYLELDAGTLSSLANRSLIKEITDKVVYLKGNQSAHGFRTLIRMKRKDDPFMNLEPSKPSPPTTSAPHEEINATDIHQLREELEKVRSQRDELRRLNDEYEEKLNAHNSAQHLPTFSLGLLDQTNKSELVHKLSMLQQERDVMGRKLDKSQELVNNLYVSLEGYSELQESFTEVQESNLIQQEIVRHLQERAVRYKKLAKLCQKQERTIQSYEEHFQKLLDSQRGQSAIFTPPPIMEYEVESVKELTEMERNSEHLLSRLEERLLLSSLHQRNPVHSQKAERGREKELPIPSSSGPDIATRLSSRDEMCYDDDNVESLSNDLREIIQSIPKLDKLMF